jgi:8-amino-7-oxononanoate synthase
MSEIEERLEELERLGLGRRLRLVSGPQGPTVLLDGRPVLLLCSNNYLGLADHPRVREAAAEAAMRWGVGAGASRLVSGTMTIHGRLEEQLAEFEGTEAALLFGSGYLANMGVISALARSGDTVFSDELNHASIVDGCRLSRAEVVVYRHRDCEHLAWSLQKHGRGHPVVVTDSVFSMDGDVAPLEDIAYVARSFGARVVVDEAHATGCIGDGGRGAVAEAGLDVDVVVGTLGKALGSYGAYVCGSAEMVRYLLNVARPFIFSTAPSPPAVAGALAALALLRGRPERVERLRSNACVLRRALSAEGFPVGDGELPIVPLIVGDARAATRFCQAALAGGVFAQAIRPPTVPDGSARLRLTAMASHTHSELELAAGVLGDAAREVGIDPAALQAPPPERVPDPEPAALEDEFEAHFGEGLRNALFDAEPAAAAQHGAAPFDAERAPEPTPPTALAPFDHEHARATAH